MQCFVCKAALEKHFPAYTGCRQPCIDIMALKTDILTYVTDNNVCNSNFRSLD